ncbi:MAG: ribose 5-phosphate isomerase B [Solirubrobacterales bacterium]
MKIAVGADHAGFDLKQKLVDALQSRGHEVEDFGTHSGDSVDYPDVAEPPAREVAVGDADLGVIVCGSGVGVAMVANKVNGVRAANAHSPEEAALSRQHNDANVLTLSGRQLSEDDALAILDSFLAAKFEGGRHERRVEKIAEVEAHNAPHVDQPA